ncbi:MAG: DMT family transporter [Rhizobiales bacterium]|nr:DMT family transporter [Hyphomicrobiales bacterium]
MGFEANGAGIAVDSKVMMLPKPTIAGNAGVRQNIVLSLLLVFVIGAWGSNYVITKIAVAINGPWVFNAFRYATAAALLAAWLCYQKGWRALLPVRGEFGSTVLIGLLQISVTTSSTNWALTHIDANRTILLAYSMPIWALFFGLVLSRDLVNLKSVIGVALGFGGLALFCAPWSMDWSSIDALTGSGAALLGSVAWALGAVLYRRFTWTSSLGQQIFLQLLTATVTAVLCAAAFEQRALAFDGRYVAIILYNALVPTILAFWFWAKILTLIPATTAGQFMLLSPIVGIVLGSLVLGEAMTPVLIASAALILGGALLASMKRS